MRILTDIVLMLLNCGLIVTYGNLRLKYERLRLIILFCQGGLVGWLIAIRI
jgi:hypothetical protein